ncbi:hypothetical protein EVJ58_g1588 [Rhodofomes roseus]|uniref:DUF6533 domain-containing protein n=1 Tax=Rhodofomes roseus TaxID=34475 RepID=A0A4Y9YYP5_9APHY|nr:hypothetical protein EVJ58_g1588 [Rhodofomes roseus]
MASKEEALIQSVFFTQMEYYCNASILVMLAYECIACLPSELKLIWTSIGSPGHWIRILYFLCRYPPVLYMTIEWINPTSTKA